jgi:hypothetical protein
MALTEAEYKSVGRPTAGPKTVRILPTGLMRLSPDLCAAKTYSVAVDKEKQQLIVCPDGAFKLWYSSPDAKSGLLTITSVFEMLGIEAKEVAGEYLVRPMKAAGFIVDLMVTVEED